MKKSKLVFIIIALLITAFLLPFASELFDIAFLNPNETVQVNIPQGSSTRGIADVLKEKGLIKSKTIFLLRVKISDYNNKLNYGTFSLNKNMSIGQIIKHLGDNLYKEKTISVTFPEGSSVEQMGSILEEKGIVTKADFLNALSSDYDYKFIKVIANGSYKYKLQGFLFPDTYEFFESATAYEIVDKMLSNFESKYLSVTDSYDNIFEIITKASIIEKEAKLDSERPTVAGVIENRLKKDMALQIDACVVYAVTDGMYDIQTLYSSHLKANSPYNTYKFKGLTPGPICNPGITSIKAALSPQKHDYLYYHTDEIKKDGSHIFTTTFEEHIATMN